MKNSKQQVALLDICLPDYFTGYHKPCLQVALYGQMTNKELAEEIMQEFNFCFDYLNEDDDKEITKLYEDYCAELNKNGDAIFYKGDPDLNEDSDLDDYECAYAYFSIINPTYVNGIMFLDK